MPPPREPKPSGGRPVPGTTAPGAEDLRAEVERLYRAHGRQIFGFFLRTGFSEDRSADLTQDVFLRVYKGLKGFERRSSPRTWIFQIARYHRANVLRDERARTEVPLPGASLDPNGGDPIIAELEDEDGPDILDELVRKEDRERLRAAIDELPPRMRQCLLHRLDGRSYKEIAIVVGCEVETVRSQLRQARERLRTILGREP